MKYTVADPTKNITVLVEEPVAAHDRAEITKLMFDEVPACEQVGYLTSPLFPESAIRLEMMGGEFCGNASLSAAAYQAMQEGIEAGETRSITLECSGVDAPFCCQISAETDENGGLVYTGTVTMPSPVGIEYKDGHPVVFLPGIAHMILPADRFTRRQIQNNIKDYASGFDIDAFGVLRWDEKAQYMEPCVYVKASDSVIWEHGCATGSTCIGYYRYLSLGQTSTDVGQPGGTIKIHIDNNRIYLTGKVRFI